MATYGLLWRFTTDPDGAGMIEGPISEPRRPLRLTLDEEDVLELETKLEGLRPDEQDDLIKGFYARRVHETEKV